MTTTSSTPIISIDNITTQINDHIIHKNLSLDIYPREILAIVGGSGSGKSMLLKAILMLLPYQTGTIKIFNQDIKNAPLKKLKSIRRNWGVMFQHGALFSSLTVLENIAFPLHEETKLNNKTIEEIARLKLSLVGLSQDVAHKFPSELSGGMIKRAAIARAIVLDPKIVFLDEPSAGLDPLSASSLDELILDLNQNLDLTIVIITHDLDTLWRTTNRVAFIGDKTVLDVKPLAELYQSKHSLIQGYFANPRAIHAKLIQEMDESKT